MYPVINRQGEVFCVSLAEIITNDNICGFAYPFKILNQTAILLLSGLISATCKKGGDLFNLEDLQSVLIGQTPWDALGIDVSHIESCVIAEDFMTVMPTENHQKTSLRDLLAPHALGGGTTKAHCASIRSVPCLCSSCASVLTHSYQSLTAPVAKYWSSTQMHSRLFSLINLPSLGKTILANVCLDDSDEYQMFPWERTTDSETGCIYSALINSHQLKGAEHAQLPMMRALALEYEDRENATCWCCQRVVDRVVTSMSLCAEDTLSKTYSCFSSMKKVDFGSMYSSALHHPQQTYTIKDNKLEAIFAPKTPGKYRYPIWYLLCFSAKDTEISQAKVINQWLSLSQNVLQYAEYGNGDELSMISNACITTFGICNKQGRDVALISYTINQPTLFNFDDSSKEYIESATTMIKAFVDGIDALKRKQVTSDDKGTFVIDKKMREGDIMEVSGSIDALWHKVTILLNSAKSVDQLSKGAFFDDGLESLKISCWQMWQTYANPEFTELRDPFQAYFLIAWCEKRLLKGWR